MTRGIQKVRLSERWSLKSERKQTGRGGWSSLSVCLLYEKNRLILQTANRVLSDKLLGSCLKFCYFEPSLAYKGGFFIKLVYTFLFIVYIIV